MSDKIPAAWSNVPIIGGQAKSNTQGVPEAPNFFGVSIPDGFLKDWKGVMRIIAMTCIGPREFYSDAPLIFEGNTTSVIQAFEQVQANEGKKEVVKYKLLVFVNTAVQAYAVDPPEWWESRKQAELAE
jgi:hypothetical protein